MQRYNNGRDLPHYIAIHNGKPLKIDRKGSGLISVSNPSLAIIGGIQPAILRQQLEENPDYFHSGFIARFFVAMPPFEAAKDNDNEIDHSVQRAWELLLDSIIKERDGCLQNQQAFVFSLTDEAKQIFREEQHRHADRQETETDAAGTIEGKFAANVLRLALILHCVQLADKDGAGFCSCEPISQKTMRCACRITEWFINEAIRTYTKLQNGGTDSTLTAEQRAVLNVLQKEGKPLTIREMKQHSRTLQRMESIESVLVELKQDGRITETFRNHEGKAGRPTSEFSIVDPCLRNRNTHNSHNYGYFDYADTPRQTENVLADDPKNAPNFSENGIKSLKNTPNSPQIYAAADGQTLENTDETAAGEFFVLLPLMH
jgi:hypothetical protein